MGDHCFDDAVSLPAVISGWRGEWNDGHAREIERLAAGCGQIGDFATTRNLPGISLDHGHEAGKAPAETGSVRRQVLPIQRDLCDERLQETEYVSIREIALP